MDDGGFNTRGASPTAASMGAKLPRVGIALKTRIVILAFPCNQIVVGAWEAVIVASPVLFTLTTPFTTSATAGFEDEYVQAPEDVEVGGAKEKSASLTTFCMSAQLPIEGAPTTVSVIVTGLGEA